MSATNRDVQAASGHFAFLDQALWKQFREAESPEAFARAWLALQCRFVGEVVGGVVVLGELDVGPFAPVASWPDDAERGGELMSAAERAIAERRPVIVSPVQADDAATVCVACPLTIEHKAFGVVALELRQSGKAPRAIVRELQWGAAWMELLYWRQQSLTDEEHRERSGLAFDMLAAVLERARWADAGQALVTELAARLDCDMVCLGIAARGRCSVRAISHAALFEEQTNLVRDIGAAMDEAVDQAAIVRFPVDPRWEYRISRAHEHLSLSHGTAPVLTIPLPGHEGVVGAITFEREGGFDDETVSLCDAVASVVGPVLHDKYLNDRSIARKNADALKQQLGRLLGPDYLGRKVALGIAALLTVFFAFAQGEYRVTSPAIIEGRVQRTLVAPFDGYLATQYARAGETVTAGQVLAELDERDLALERIRWSTRQQQALAEYDQALAQQRRAEANIVRAQIRQAEAQVALLDAQLARTRITAPFDGIIVEGDLSQSVGTALGRGQELFRIAPVDEHRVILEVDDNNIEEIRTAQNGTLRLAAMPDRTLEYAVERITPVAEQADGRNYFRVEARLEPTDLELRPGMEGVAKTAAGRRLLIDIWTRSLVDWLRLTLWRWTP